MNRKTTTTTMARGKRTLAIFGLAATAAILGSAPAFADDHSTAVPALHAITGSAAPHDDHTTGGADDHTTGGSDDHSTLADDDHSTLADDDHTTGLDLS
ncbi:hypothetical protein VR41_01625 [Streptomyces sp. NRRL B-1568]|nr:hypothetical protein VR41_01625 [Streptomyces sp. NRRL B-1568]